jgi:hypothetical protein
MSITPTEQIAVNLIFDDYECPSRLLPLFFEVREFEEDGINAREKREFDDADWLQNDVWHRIECRETGYPFEVCYHIVAGVIEWRAHDNSWRYLFRVVKATHRPDLLWFPKLRLEGNLRELCRYAAGLKTAQPDYYKFHGFEAVEAA